MAWWCFPFERLIGTLQKINTNNHIGGELEGTIAKSFWRGANLRRYLNRSDCPEVIKQFKILFDLSFSPQNDRSVESTPQENGNDRANYTHQAVNYSRSSTHLGNSLVMYYPSANSPLIPGSIQRIQTDGEKTIFHIQRQAALPSDKFDPFLLFPHFPAKTYSSRMESTIDKVAPSSFSTYLETKVFHIASAAAHEVIAKVFLGDATTSKLRTVQLNPNLHLPFGTACKISGIRIAKRSLDGNETIEHLRSTQISQRRENHLAAHPTCDLSITRCVAPTHRHLPSSSTWGQSLTMFPVK
ncbi:hypothetical protein B0H16DRAFT_1761269 [Mycena metata]|uniref:Uncharacterized protein n=1 Tax=Mycena metata TaxID=1033252 RepID=A0AAD7MZ92_9AGAR|nr:hypothetical protein B0H16DRAFT_1761269 [Mycena metata]